jgi:glycosyltransferase involved in cell wall biosynthesis
MMILHVETGMSLYGGAQQVLYLLQGLKARGHVNVLVCPRNSAIGGRAAQYADRLYALRMRGDHDLPFIWHLRRVIRRERPDIVHIHSRRGADTLGGIAAQLAGVKTVLSRRVDNTETRPLVRIKYRLYDGVITISRGIREVLLAEGLPATKIHCVPSAVDVALYRRECDRAWFTDTFGVPPAATTIGVIAQLIARKGHRHLLDAMPAILRAQPGTRLLLFGRGPMKEELRQHIARLGIADHVTLTGFREDMPRIIGCLDLVVHPALKEGLGVSLLQAAGAGIPIVATRVGGIPEAVHDGENGLLVPPADAAALAEAIGRLLAEPPLRRTMGERGRVLVERDFSVDAMVSGNLRVYEAVLAGA